jgi:hypothetical protein
MIAPNERKLYGNSWTTARKPARPARLTWSVVMLLPKYGPPETVAVTWISAPR